MFADMVIVILCIVTKLGTKSKMEEWGGWRVELEHACYKFLSGISFEKYIFKDTIIQC